MLRYVAVADLAQPEREKVLLLLAAAADDEWRPVRDGRRGLCVEWRVAAGHPVLAALRPNTPQRHTPAAFTQTSPWTIDRSNDSANDFSCFPSRDGDDKSDAADCKSRDGAHRSGAMAVNASGEAKFSHSARARTPRPRSVDSPTLRCASTGRASPFLNARSMFLHRQSSLPRARSGSRQSGGAGAQRSPVPRQTPAPAPAPAGRSAQWVSRLAEDVVAHVARMPLPDTHTTKSVADVTGAAVTTRYGALQWRRALNDFARGLHTYAKVCPLCRIFRGFFVDTSALALEDFFLFSNLRQSALRHSSAEMQKVLLTPDLAGGENSGDEHKSGGGSGPLFQNAIISRRYVDLRALTTVLNETLTSLTIREYSDGGARRLARKRRLQSSEVLGVKTIVAQWVEETSGRDSLAFDLPGYVDFYEFLSAVVTALRSVRDTEITRTETEQQPTLASIMKSETKTKHVVSSTLSSPSRIVAPSKHVTPPRHSTPSKPLARSPLVSAVTSSYASRARAIMQQPRAPGANPPVHAYEEPPAPIVVDLSAPASPPPKRKEKEKGEMNYSAERGSVPCAANSSPSPDAAQVRQYFAALAAIDAEIERRRGTLDATRVALVESPDRHGDSTARMNGGSNKESGDGNDDGDDDAGRVPQRIPGQWQLDEALESSEPPAVASTFTDKAPLHFSAQRPALFLSRSSHQPKDARVGKRQGVEAGAERNAMLDDMEMLSVEERGLLADLRQALDQKRPPAMHRN